MANSYSILKTKNELKNNTLKNIFGIEEIIIEKKANYEEFNLFECKIKKEIVDEIFFYKGDKIEKLQNYFKIFILDIFHYKDKNIAIIRGKYEARDMLLKLLKDTEIKELFAFGDFCNLNLRAILDKVNLMKTISIKDLTASINKIKATGNLDKNNEIIQELIEKGSEITALTIEYPCENETTTIHIKSDCNIRVSNCDILSTIEREGKFLINLYQFLRGENEI